MDKSRKISKETNKRGAKQPIEDIRNEAGESVVMKNSRDGSKHEDPRAKSMPFPVSGLRNAMMAYD